MGQVLNQVLESLLETCDYVVTTNVSAFSACVCVWQVRPLHCARARTFAQIHPPNREYAHLMDNIVRMRRRKPRPLAPAGRKIQTMAEVHVIGELVGGSDFPSGDLFCRWGLSHGSGWRVLEGLSEGQTQIDHPQVCIVTGAIDTIVSMPAQSAALASSTWCK